MFIIIVLAAIAGFGVGFITHLSVGKGRAAIDQERRKSLKALTRESKALNVAQRGLAEISRGARSPDLVAQKTLDEVDTIRYNDKDDAK